MTTRSPSTRILLVDDDLDGLRLLEQHLRRAGHEVEVASAADDALQKFDAFQPHVAIIDIGLPDIDGYELARCIRERSDCKLFALSGFSAQTAPNDNAVTAFDRHFIKPVVNATLLQAVDECLGASSRS
jgi:CheY-like chemotaxis protein